MYLISRGLYNYYSCQSIREKIQELPDIRKTLATLLTPCQSVLLIIKAKLNPCIPKPERRHSPCRSKDGDLRTLKLERECQEKPTLPSVSRGSREQKEHQEEEKKNSSVKSLCVLYFIVLFLHQSQSVFGLWMVLKKISKQVRGLRMSFPQMSLFKQEKEVLKNNIILIGINIVPDTVLGTF